MAMAKPKRAYCNPGLGMALSPCGLCGSLEGMPIFEAGGIPIVRCKQCQHVYARLQAVEPSRIYGEGYYHSVRRDGVNVEFRVEPRCRHEVERRTFLSRLESIESRLGRKGCLLDVGCGLGEFLAVARDHGWQVEGIEPSEYAAQYVRRTHQISVHSGTLDTYLGPPESFDVITLYDVIEHVSYPLDLLLAVHRMLKPGGLAHLVTPDFHSLSARLLGKHWYHLKPFEHIHFFTPRTIANLVAATPFTLLEVRPSRHLMTPSYVLDRLRIYNQRLFGALLVLSERLWGNGPGVKISIGEMEVWLSRGN